MPRKSRIYATGSLHQNDVRILGDGDFGWRVLASAEEYMKKRYALRSRGYNLERVISMVSEVLGVKPEEVWAKGKYKRIIEARSLMCFWAVRELGFSMSSLGRKLGISIPSASESVLQGKRIAEVNDLHLVET